MIPQVQLGQTDIKVGNVGHGLMLLTWAPLPHVADSVAFESIKAAVDGGATYLDAGAFYGPDDDQLANFKLLRRFFDANPTYVDKVFLSVKGGGRSGAAQTDDFLRKDIDSAIDALGPRKKIDLFQLGRNVRPVEETVPLFAKFIEEGKFDYIGLSEASAATLRKAHAIHPITATEVEASVWALEKELFEVIAAAEELNVTIVGYAPLGRGLLVTKWKTNEDIPEGDMRKDYPRFSNENLPTNLKLVSALDKLAAKRGIPTAQLAIAYVLKLSPKMIAIPGSSKKERTLENVGAGNVSITKEEFEEVNKILKELPGAGSRYGGFLEKMVWL